jgi:hypothetical protein
LDDVWLAQFWGLRKETMARLSIFMLTDHRPGICFRIKIKLDLASFSSCTCTTRQITWCTWSSGYDHVMQLDSFSFLFLLLNPCPCLRCGWFFLAVWSVWRHVDES